MAFYLFLTPWLASRRILKVLVQSEIKRLIILPLGKNPQQDMWV
jgi:hypothetical protein